MATQNNINISALNNFCDLQNKLDELKKDLDDRLNNIKTELDTVYNNTNLNNPEYYSLDGTLSHLRKKDQLLNMDPLERAEEMKKYPQIDGSLCIKDSIKLALVQGSDPYSRRANEALLKGFWNYKTVPGELAPEVTGYDPNGVNGPIPWGSDELRLMAMRSTSKYISPYFEELFAGDGRGETTAENIRAFTRYRFNIKNLLSNDNNGNTLLYPGMAQGLNGTPAFNLSRTIKLSSPDLGVTTLVSPTPFYVTPFAAMKFYGGKSDDIACCQGATDSNVPMCVSAFASYPLEDMINAVQKNVYWFNNTGSSPTGPAPFSMYQIYLTTDDDINISIMARAKKAGYKVLLVTLDAGHSHAADRMYQMASHIPSFADMASSFFSDPVFNWKCYNDIKFVGSTDPNVLAYCATKSGKTVQELAALYNKKEAFTYVLPRILNGLRLCNVTTDPNSLLYKHSVKYLASMAHSVDVSHNVIRDLYPEFVNIKLPLVIKGTVNVDECLAIQANGADGVVVSNHGGRLYDQCPATIDIVSKVKAAVKAKDPNFGIWLDSGIRRGTDILVAYANSADFVAVGRPCQYANVIGGRWGVRQVLCQMAFVLRKACQTVGLPDLNNSSNNAKVVLPLYDENNRPIGHSIWN
jgi:isopentenyl diphosphate isomerase/L-lactate dehydrogenase-like FMN-dependent dehydrogenase